MCNRGRSVCGGWGGDSAAAGEGADDVGAGDNTDELVVLDDGEALDLLVGEDGGDLLERGLFRDGEGRCRHDVPDGLLLCGPPEDIGFGVIRVNHGTSEEAGMMTLADYINESLDVSAEYLPTGCVFQLVGPDGKPQ